MKAIVLSFDRHRAITEHLMLQYDRLWPDHPFRFRVPYQRLCGKDTERAEYIESPPQIASTVLRLIEDIDDEEWVYWCSDDKYPIRLVLEKIRQLLGYIPDAPELSGLLFCRTRVTLERPDIALLPERRTTSHGDVLLERRGWYQIWIHQFLRAKVLRYLFSRLPIEIASAKMLDKLKNEITKPEEFRLFVTEKNYAVFGESTQRGAITRNCLQSIRRTQIDLPQWFRRSNGRCITMGELSTESYWQKLRRRFFPARAVD